MPGLKTTYTFRDSETSFKKGMTSHMHTLQNLEFSQKNMNHSRYFKKRFNSENWRLTKLLERLRKQRSEKDIICFQEVWNYRSFRKLSLIISASCNTKRNNLQEIPRSYCKTSHLPSIKVYVLACCYQSNNNFIAQVCFICKKQARNVISKDSEEYSAQVSSPCSTGENTDGTVGMKAGSQKLFFVVG